MEPINFNPRNDGKAKKAVIVDSDGEATLILGALLRSLKFETIALQSLGTQEQFPKVDLVVTNFFVQGVNTLPIIRNTRLLNRRCVIFAITEEPDKAQTSHAFQSGADRVFAKPLDRTAFICALKRYIEPWHFEPNPFHSLTLREREVLNLIVEGLTNKETAIELGISNRTVDVHRSRIMDKLCARNFADLVRMVLADRSGSVDPI